MAFFIGQATAQSTPPDQGIEELEFKDIEELSLEKLLDITISIAAGRAQRLEDAPSIVSVITDEEIRRLGARTLAEVLQIVPGFEVLIDNLGQGRIVVRGVVSGATGGSSENILILFNGHRLNEDGNGGATIVNLDIPVDNIKRVEVIRGPGSALYGANAFLGVINIVTYRAEEIQGVKISSGGGSFRTQQHNLLAGYTLGEVGLSAFVQFKDTQGPRLSVPVDSQTIRDRQLAFFGFPPVSLAPGKTNDDRSAVDANIQLTYKGLTINSRLKDEHAGGFVGPQDSLGNSKLDNRQISLDVVYRHPFSDSLSLSGKFGFNQNENRRFFDNFPPGFTLFSPVAGVVVFPRGVLLDFTTNTRRFEGEVVLDYQLFKGNDFTLGFSFAHSRTFGLETEANFNAATLTPLPSLRRAPFDVLKDARRNVYSIFAQDIWNPLPELGITAGLRYDRYNDFGDTVDPRVGVVWRFVKDFYLKLLYGSAFRAPSFLETSFNIPNLVLGASGLQPSTLQTVEAAVGYTRENKFHISANYFATFIRDFIVPTSAIGPTGAQAATFTNSEGIDVQGVEIEMKVQIWDHVAFANYTYQHPKDKASGNRLPDVPSHLGNLGITLALGDYFRLTPSALFRGSRGRLTVDPRKDAPGYALFDLTLQAKTPVPGLDISGTVNNLFDKDYSHPAPTGGVPGDYPRPGRSFFLKAIYKF